MSALSYQLRLSGVEAGKEEADQDYLQPLSRWCWVLPAFSLLGLCVGDEQLYKRQAHSLPHSWYDGQLLL